ncbi:MAG: helix-turn-helix transcriptional regulator [Euryarchaeota archaeon]|nr:helix-turn-helix transcriptional regulator [Euryarchaeota archaeon]
MNRKRNERGRYVEQITLEDVRNVLVNADEPLTATEIGETLDITNRAALNKLDELRESDDVKRKRVGASAVVWWLTDAEDESAFARRLSRKTIADQYDEDYFGSNPEWADDLPDLGENA